VQRQFDLLVLKCLASTIENMADPMDREVKQAIVNAMLESQQKGLDSNLQLSVALNETSEKVTAHNAKIAAHNAEIFGHMKHTTCHVSANNTQITNTVLVQLGALWEHGEEKPVAAEVDDEDDEKECLAFAKNIHDPVDREEKQWLVNAMLEAHGRALESNQRMAAGLNQTNQRMAAELNQTNQRMAAELNQATCELSGNNMQLTKVLIDQLGAWLNEHGDKKATPVARGG
jgi:hypothetical protein